jgi:electron transfer flavoprotein alpha subunit
MKVLVFLEHASGTVVEPSLAVLSKARSLAPEELAGVLIGDGVGALAAEAGRFGADHVFVADDVRLTPPLPQPRVDVVASIVDQAGYDTILFAASVLGADVAAGLSARLEAGLNWDLVDLAVEDGRLVGTRPALADSVYAQVGWTGEPRIAIFRAGALQSVESDRGAEVETVSVRLEGHSTRSTMLERIQEDRTGPSIEDADIVVAGGRGMGGPDGVALVEGLAHALNGAVGATRPVVDIGWMPFSSQIGQTGRTVTPKLYVACGISGAIQHKVGMQRSTLIVAINKDRNAPIFELADLGIVGDLREVVPRLTALIQARGH